ncbi:hypothetical protein JX265_007198 [Neoarthrinium moseri]|uniref:Cytochrome P450 monooxygenase n=1 Tax=Neoarthrinium moseri TaxID=1658444 RepID=A0A9P9WL54_9PEZI|nr:hypothetical protein JX265_007198 [Neoarthrinium moseri]
MTSFTLYHHLGPTVAAVVCQSAPFPEKFPGPLLARATRVYYSYYRSAGQLELKTRELHDTYGSIVRIAPNELSFTGGTSWDDIYGLKSKRRPWDRLQKEPFFYMGAIAPNGEKNLGASSDGDHVRIRGVLAHALSEKALYSQEDVLRHHADRMVHRISSLSGSPTDAVRWLHHCTYDVISDLALGISADTLECNDWSPQAHLMFEGIKEGVTVIEVLRFMPFRNQMMRLLMSIFGQARRKAFDAAVEKATLRMATNNWERPDFMSYIMKANETSRELTVSEITANVALLLDVGSETTASLLAGSLFYLTKHPAILTKLTSLVREEFEEESLIDSKSLSRLPYLTAVLRETLRVYPPVAGATPRVTPPQGCPIDGRFVPGNVSVAINHYATYRDVNNFKNPDKFNPERWLEKGYLTNHQHEIFQPFSHGARNCLGRNLAWAEMRLFIGLLLWNFDLELTTASKNWNVQRSWFIWDKPDLMMRFHERAR